MSVKYKIYTFICLLISSLMITHPALAAGVDTQVTGLLDKIVDTLISIRGPAITIGALIGAFTLLLLRQWTNWFIPLIGAIIIFIAAPYFKEWL